MELSLAQQLKTPFSISLSIVQPDPAAVHDQAEGSSRELWPPPDAQSKECR